jgi:hypothetical protein
VQMVELLDPLERPLRELELRRRGHPRSLSHHRRRTATGASAL